MDNEKRRKITIENSEMEIETGRKLPLLWLDVVKEELVIQIIPSNFRIYFKLWV